MNPMFLNVKRIYDKPEKADGFRILVDRLWPRGLTKEKARVDEWLKDIAPSDELRKWFSHDPKKWGAFKKRYFEELENKKALVELLMKKSKTGPVTLLYAAKDERFNNALALKEYLETRRKYGKWIFTYRKRRNRTLPQRSPGARVPRGRF